MKYYTNIKDVLDDLDQLKHIAYENFHGDRPEDSKLNVSFDNDRDVRRIVSRSVSCSSMVASKGRVGPGTHFIMGHVLSKLVKDSLIQTQLRTYLSLIEVIEDDRMSDNDCHLIMTIRIFTPDLLDKIKNYNFTGPQTQLYGVKIIDSQWIRDRKIDKILE